MKRLTLAASLTACAMLVTGTIGCGNASDSADNDTDSVTTVLPSKIAEVKTMKLGPKMFSHETMSNGKVSAHDFADLSFASTDAVIDRIMVKNGQHVKKGQAIASLDRFKLENTLSQNLSDLESARLELADVLIGQGYDPEKPGEVPADVMKLARLRSGLDKAETVLQQTRRELENSTLTAPFDGVVANLFQKVHNRPDNSQPFCRIVASGGMDVEFKILESELSVIRQGDRVTVTSFSTGETSDGTVSEINPVVNEDGLVTVRASVHGTGLFDGMNVKVSVKRDLENALVVPKSAVVLRTGKQVVFTHENGKAMWNYVTTGLENMNEYIITDGLTEGMEVIYDGNVNLAHESPVTVVNDEK